MSVLISKIWSEYTPEGSRGTQMTEGDTGGKVHKQNVARRNTVFYRDEVSTQLQMGVNACPFQPIIRLRHNLLDEIIYRLGKSEGTLAY